MAETTESVYSINFDVDQFVKNVQSALDAVNKLEGNTDKLDDAMKLLQAQVNKVSFSKPIAETQKLQDEFDQLKKSGKIDLSQFNKSIDTFLKSAPEMESFLNEIRTIMKHLGEDSEEFKRLSNVVNIVEQSLKDLKESADDTDKGGFVPLKKRLKELKISMQQLEDQGKENTEEYRKQRLEAARLTDQLGDQAEAVRVLASDTYALDAAVDTLKTVTAGFQLFEGAMALAGGTSEEMQQAMTKLMALMNIANGLQEIQNFLTGQSAGKLALQAVWTKALALANGLLGTTTAAATGATRAFSVALASTGIGAIVVAVGLLVAALVDWIDTSDDAKEATDRLNESIKNQEEALERSLSALERDQKKRIALLKKQGASEQEIFDAQIDGQQKALAKQQYDYLVSYERYQKFKAAAQKRGNKDELEKVEEERVRLNKQADQIANLENDILVAQLERDGENNKKRKEEGKKNAEELFKLQESYATKLQELRNRALDIKDEQSPKSEKSIRARYDREFKLEEAELRKTYAKLGKAKVDAIVNQARAVNQLQADASVKGFKEDSAKTQKEILDNLASQQSAVANEKIALIQDEYARTNAEIKKEEEDRRAELNRQYDQTIELIKSKELAGEISPEQARSLSATAEKILLEGWDVASEKAKKKALDNQAKIFESLLEQAQRYASLQDAQAENAITKRILTESENLKKGEISYEEYQKRITQIQKEANEEILRNDIKQGEEKLKILRDQLAAEKDEKVKQTIETTIAQTEAGINTAKSKLNEVDKELDGVDSLIGKIFGTKDKKDIDEFEQAVQEAVNQTVNLIKQTAAAEVDAADKAVESQRKRVDEATKIAELGNAEYLKQEEDRLRQLELKREQAARKQLQIDAALQASQILVAVASAAAQIREGGAIKVATGIASIIAAIASGAALVKSLQNNQPKFFEGTDYVRRGKNPVGRDTIPAMLNEGEAVISTDVNKRYSPTIKAIRRGLIPEGVMNDFVNSYGKGINYHRVGQAVEINKSSKFDDSKFIEMNERLGRLESVMTTTAQAIQGLGVNIRMDEDGFAASINTHLSKRNKVYNS